MIETKEISVRTIVSVPIEKVWKFWTTPADIKQCNNPFKNWHSTRVEVDLKKRCRFFFRMEAKDGSSGFDHAGIYNKVIPHWLIEYTLDDCRKATVTFFSNDGETVTETFEPELITPIEIQKEFCETILKNLKNYEEKTG